MDYEFGYEEQIDVDSIVGGYDVDYDDEALTLPEDELFEI